MLNFKKFFLFILIIILDITLVSCNSNAESKIISEPLNSVSYSVSKSTSPSVDLNTASTPAAVALNSNFSKNITTRSIFKKTFPILYYHCISDNISGMPELHVSPSEFEKQMKYLKDNNYEVITFDEIDNIQIYKKPIIITFDDGYENNYLEAYPILKKYNFKATIFLCSNFINASSMLKEKEIVEMSDIINFQGHSVSHPNLTELSPKDIEHELLNSKKIIEKLTNKEITTFAYPTGYYNEKVLSLVMKYYKYGVTNKGGFYSYNVSNYEIKRVYIPRKLTIYSFTKKLICSE